MPREELLELLANRKGCFISSLRNPSDHNETLRLLQQISVSEYKLEEWNDCLTYLAGREVSMRSKDDVRRYLEEAIGTEHSGL